MQCCASGNGSAVPMDALSKFGVQIFVRPRGDGDCSHPIGHNVLALKDHDGNVLSGHNAQTKRNKNDKANINGHSTDNIYCSFSRRPLKRYARTR